MRAANDNGPRLIGRKEAAGYLGIGESTFSLWVATHKMPPPIAGTRKWDKHAIDAKLDAISGLDKHDNDDAVESELENWRRQRDARKAQGPSQGKKTARNR